MDTRLELVHSVLKHLANEWNIEIQLPSELAPPMKVCMNNAMEREWNNDPLPFDAEGLRRVTGRKSAIARHTHHTEF